MSTSLVFLLDIELALLTGVPGAEELLTVLIGVMDLLHEPFIYDRGFELWSAFIRGTRMLTRQIT